MRRGWIAAALLAVTLAGCNDGVADSGKTLAEARKGVDAGITSKVTSNLPLDAPPAGVLERTSYISPAGTMAAYITPRPVKPGRYPALIWISGGDFSSIGDFWSPAPPENDQTARAFRRDGMVVFYPSTRGGNMNPGSHEGFYGEVDDVIAALQHVKTLDYVDPNRIYLAGHSTGATLVMLVSEMTDGFRAAFAFGPVSSPALYGSALGPDFLPFNVNDQRAMALRSPGIWLASVRTPLFVIEGQDAPGNYDQLVAMKAGNRNALVQFRAAAGYIHFSVLAPATALLADRLIADTASKPQISLTEADLARP